MKNLHYLFLVVLMAFTGCSSGGSDGPATEPVKLELSSSSPYVTISNNGASAAVAFRPFVCDAAISVKLTGTSDWDAVATSGGDMFTVSKSTASFTIACKGENESGAPNTGTVTVTAGSGNDKVTATINITQEAYGNVRLSISPTSVTIPGTGGDSEPVTVTTEASQWDFEAKESWLDGRKDGDKLILTAQANDSSEAKTAEVKITATEGSDNTTEILYVTLAGKGSTTPTLTFTFTDVRFTTFGGKETITVETNQADWTVGEASEGWVTAKKDGSNIVFTASPNEDESEQTATVKVSAGDGAISKDITVKIDGRTALMIFEANVTSTGSPLVLPLAGTAENCGIEWGDGTATRFNDTASASNLASHQYSAAGTYTVRVSGKVTALNSGTMNDASNKAITKVTAWGATGLESMEGAFEGVTSLASIPEDSEQSFAAVTTFAKAFAGCTGLATIPGKLFQHATAALSFEGAFSNTAIAAVPAGLFDANSKAENFGSVFEGCKSLVTLPESLFYKNSKATSYNKAFAGCTSLAATPNRLFNGTSVTADHPTGAEGIFSGCTALKTLHQSLFNTFGNAASFARAFEGCTSLTTIPVALFSAAVLATSFEATFLNCSAITEITLGTFNSNTEAANFHQTFKGCSAMKTFNYAMFDSNLKIENVKEMFHGCSAWDGRSISSQPSRYLIAAFWERLEWGYTKITEWDKCYYGCTKLTDYDQIPEGWK